MTATLEVFGAAELARLRGLFPLRDVLKLAGQVSRKHAAKPFRDPARVLEKWLENAEANDADRLDLEARPATAEPAIEWGERGDPEVARCYLARIYAMLDESVTPPTIHPTARPA